MSAYRDPLEELARIVDFKVFRPALVATLAYGDGAKGGRPPYDPVAMLKVLILAAQNNVRDARMEYLIRDRLSWMRFLGFDLGAATPDANTTQARLAGLPRAVREIAWEGQIRFCARYRKLIMAGKLKTVVESSAPYFAHQLQNLSASSFVDGKGAKCKRLLITNIRESLSYDIAVRLGHAGLPGPGWPPRSGRKGTDRETAGR